ncbi:MAG: alpha/beta fold hydrolase [Candidatus Omnitrophica bacterium]|nr:alpha/beta fold hydrolase [Candidatus Omnitrophota bacterium]
MLKDEGILSTEDAVDIAYCHYLNDKRDLIVIAHGFYNSKDAVLLQKLAQSLGDEYDIFMFDFRGHGKSGGFFSWVSREGKDLRAVLKHIEGKYDKTGIIAFSLGASICINTLAELSTVWAKSPGIDSLVCLSPPCELKKIDYKFWFLNWREDLIYTLFTAEGRKGKGVRPGPFWLKKKKPAEEVSKLKIPVFYIHGDKDWVVKPWHSQVLYNNTKSEKRLLMIKGGPHAEYLLKEFSGQIVPAIKRWFGNKLIQEGS